MKEKGDFSVTDGYKIAYKTQLQFSSKTADIKISKQIFWIVISREAKTYRNGNCIISKDQPKQIFQTETETESQQSSYSQSKMKNFK